MSLKTKGIGFHQEKELARKRIPKGKKKQKHNDVYN
jgi:hypothetical protein